MILVSGNIGGGHHKKAVVKEKIKSEKGTSEESENFSKPSSATNLIKKNKHLVRQSRYFFL